MWRAGGRRTTLGRRDVSDPRSTVGVTDDAFDVFLEGSNLAERSRRRQPPANQAWTNPAPRVERSPHPVARVTVFYSASRDPRRSPKCQRARSYIPSICPSLRDG